MAWLKRCGRAIWRAARWVVGKTRNRLSPRGQVIFDYIVGGTLVLLGLLTGPVPVIQGWMFGVPGLIILSRHNKWARRFLEKLKSAGRKLRSR